jgi:ribosomal protein S11
MLGLQTVAGVVQGAIANVHSYNAGAGRHRAVRTLSRCRDRVKHFIACTPNDAGPCSLIARRPLALLRFAVSFVAALPFEPLRLPK